jgi:hypothetical protein
MGSRARSMARKFVWSYVAGLVLTLLLGAVATRPDWSAAGMLLAPGMLAGAIVFPDGFHSGFGVAYPVIVVLMDAFFMAWLLLGLWSLIQHIRKRNQADRSAS